MTSGLQFWSLAYDASVHALFLGFVMSMIMAHAPIVIPALTGLAFPFTSALWLPLILLQLTLPMRVVGGLAGSWEWRRWGAMLNAITLTIFLLMVIAIVVWGQILRRRATVLAV